MKITLEAMKAYLESHPFDPGSDNCPTVLEQIYLAYSNSHELDPPEILADFSKLETFLEALSLTDRNAIFCLIYQLCNHYERKAFVDGVQYGAHLISELYKVD